MKDHRVKFNYPTSSVYTSRNFGSLSSCGFGCVINVLLYFQDLIGLHLLDNPIDLSHLMSPQMTQLGIIKQVDVKSPNKNLPHNEIMMFNNFLLAF